MNYDPAVLTESQIVNALALLSEGLGEQGIDGEICLFGGAVMVIAFKARVATKDVDAIFAPAAEIRQCAAAVADKLALPENWLNDGVKGFIATPPRTTTGSLPQFPHLRVTMPSAEYMLAMKCLAARMGSTDGAGSDVPDIRTLINHLNLTSADAVLDIVALYYPGSKISPKTKFLVEEIFASS